MKAEHLLPEHIRGGVERYIEHGVPPGSFLTAVIEGDLFAAMEAADDINQKRMFDICCWFYNHAPRGSYGSPESMKHWLAVKAKERENHTE